ncbi:hypothetical protein CDAR_410981 [Caerostris darwini]|uniref:Uncharacterized protein n=1 Tax=Caerostris darwini TaxID=1538125 RepID=A0AAV4SHK4_9ARAC|nr:hypothetical protein CDAR_410981 [Caerostris darwini]
MSQNTLCLRSVSTLSRRPSRGRWRLKDAAVLTTPTRLVGRAFSRHDPLTGKLEEAIKIPSATLMLNRGRKRLHCVPDAR